MELTGAMCGATFDAPAMISKSQNAASGAALASEAMILHKLLSEKRPLNARKSICCLDHTAPVQAAVGGRPLLGRQAVA